MLFRNDSDKSAWLHGLVSSREDARGGRQRRFRRTAL